VIKSLVFLSLVSVLYVAPAIAQPPKTTVITDEEQRVFQAVLIDFIDKSVDGGTSKRKKQSLVILSQTVGDRWPGSEQDLSKLIKYLLKHVRDTTTTSYFKNKSLTAVITSRFEIRQPYQFLSKEDFTAMFGTGRYGWTDFYKRYPDSDGFIAFSRAGFDTAGKQALVYMEHGCGSLCAEGYYVLLKKNIDRWRVVDKKIAGMS